MLEGAGHLEPRRSALEEDVELELEAEGQAAEAAAAAEAEVRVRARGGVTPIHSRARSFAPVQTRLIAFFFFTGSVRNV